MARDWDALFESWKKPPSDSEENRAESIRAAITKAIVTNPRFANLHPKMVLHGSYALNTNVRLTSDVDVAVVITDYSISDFSQAPGLRLEDVGLKPASYSLQQARQDVEAALREHFGSTRVTGKNKAVHIAPSPGQLEADVIACFEHRRHLSSSEFRSGICFQPLQGAMIENWPAQNKANSHAKADRTHRRYKKIIRILKRATNEMEEQRTPGAVGVPGCLIEALAYNVPDSGYGFPTLRKDVRAVIAEIYNKVETDVGKKWVEVNGLEWLFHSKQKWNQAQAKAWSLAVWNYCELQNA